MFKSRQLLNFKITNSQNSFFFNISDLLICALHLMHFQLRDSINNKKSVGINAAERYQNNKNLELRIE